MPSYAVILQDRSAFIGSTPNLLLLCSSNQPFTEIRMCNGDDSLRALPGRTSGEHGNTIFRNDAGRLCSGRCNHVALCKFRKNAGAPSAGFICKGRCHRQKRLAMLCHICASYKIELSARSADVARARGFRADLAIKIHRYAAVDRYKVIQLTDRFGVVHIAHRRRENIRILVKKFVERTRTGANGKYAFSAVEPLFLFVTFPA